MRLALVVGIIGVLAACIDLEVEAEKRALREATSHLPEEDTTVINLPCNEQLVDLSEDRRLSYLLTRKATAASDTHHYYIVSGNQLTIQYVIHESTCGEY